MSTAIQAKSSETLIIAGRKYKSRLIIGTGKYRSYDQMRHAHTASGAEMVTVAVRRVPLDRSSESFLDHLDPALHILPNTAGCYSADEAVRTARLAREALRTDLVKLEVIGDKTTLFPDNEQTLAAAQILVREGFVVLPYFNDDLIMAKKLLDAGCAAIMPLAAPIGSGMGVQNPANLRIMREQLPDATIIVDAGVGTASDAAVAMELGADAVLMNTAIAEATDPAKMATAMKLAIQAGRLAYQAGRMPRRLYASASSPVEGVVK
jgi:thiazole synthase